MRGGTTIACGQSRRACAAAHRGAHAERLRLVAGGEHDAAADDHRPAAQPRVVALLDRRVERVEVGVEDRRPPDTNICSHHGWTDTTPPLERTFDVPGHGRVVVTWTVPGTSTTSRSAVRRSGSHWWRCRQRCLAPRTSRRARRQPPLERTFDVPGNLRDIAAARSVGVAGRAGDVPPGARHGQVIVTWTVPGTGTTSHVAVGRSEPTVAMSSEVPGTWNVTPGASNHHDRLPTLSSRSLARRGHRVACPPPGCLRRCPLRFQAPS